MEYDSIDRPTTYTIDHQYLVQAFRDGEEVDFHLTDELGDAHKAFARMSDERRGNVVTIYDSHKLDYVASFRAGQKRHALTRDLIDLIFNPAGA